MYIHACTVYPELVSTWSYVYSQLLERKKGQSVEDVSQSIECLCHIMTTVGSRLDTDKAKVILKVVLNNNYSMPLSSSFSLQGPLCPIQNMWQLKTTSTINPLLPCFRNHIKIWGQVDWSWYTVIIRWIDFESGNFPSPKYSNFTHKENFWSVRVHREWCHAQVLQHVWVVSPEDPAIDDPLVIDHWN